MFDRINVLQPKMMMDAARNAITAASKDFEQAKADIEKIRGLGHKFDIDLEKLLASQEGTVSSAQKLLDQQTAGVNNTLRPELDSIMNQLHHASSSSFGVGSLRTRLDQVEQRLEQSEQEIRDKTAKEFAELARCTSRIKALAWAYQQAEEASFDSEEGEGLVSAWEAQWLAADEKSGPWGVLYLTTKRVVFEQKEKVKTGGIFSKKEMRQMLAFWHKVENISKSADTEKRKFLGKKEVLALEFKSGDPLKVNMRLKTDSEEVDKRIEDFIAGKLG